MSAQATERNRAAVHHAVQLHARRVVTAHTEAAAQCKSRSVQAAHFGNAAGAAAAARLPRAVELLAQVTAYRGEALRAFVDGVRTGTAVVEAVADFAAS